MTAESWVCMPDGRTVAMNSLTPDEKKFVIERMSLNMAKAIERAWLNYPADRPILAECILKSGGTLTASSGGAVLWTEEMTADDEICHTDYLKGNPDKIIRIPLKDYREFYKSRTTPV